MSLLSAQGLDFNYGREPILAGASLNLQPGVKYALIGANGTGKSTLLAILAGELSPHQGAVELSGGVGIRFLRQETTIDSDDRTPVYDIVAAAAFGREREIENELARLGEQLIREPHRAATLSETQSALQMEFERRDGYTWRARLEATLTGLGLDAEARGRPAGELSGGQRRRAALAATLLGRAEILLLDEPTNHLDLAARTWLEERIARLSSTVVIVSHDRYFLDRATTRTLHLNGGDVVDYGGNYTFFLKASRERLERDEKTWRRQQDKIEKTEDFIRRNLAGQKTKQAQSRRRQLAREERQERPAGAAPNHRIRLEAGRSSGAVVLEAHNISKSYGDLELVRDFSLLVTRGQRIGILGSNGCGKSTLLRMLAGELFPDAGHVDWGHNVDLGHYNQQLSSVTDTNTVLEEIASVWAGAPLGQLRSFAAAFGFDAEMIDRPVGRLSGGERARLSLMRLVREGHNTLLMDEPTNHLDAASCEALEEALCDFHGSLIVISHDRRFLDRVIGTLLVFDADDETPPRPRIFDGNYSAYQQYRKERAEGAARLATTSAKPRTRPRVSGLSKNEIQRRRARIEDLEEEISQLEQMREDALGILISPDTTPDARLAASEKIKVQDIELSAAYEEWENLNDEIEST